MANKQNIIVTQTGAETASKGLDKVDKSLAAVGAQAISVAAAFFAVKKVVGASITAYGIQEQAETKLAVALGAVNKGLLEQASALQKVSIFGDEAIIGVQASIAAFTKNTDEIKAATAATLDFASAQGMDLKGAGDLIAKTLGSSTNALTKYGITVTGAVGSSERLAQITEGIAKLWGGQAKAAAETMAGSMSQAGNAVGDLAEVLGELLSPAIISGSKLLKEAAEAVLALREEYKKIDENPFFGNIESLEELNTKYKELLNTNNLLEIFENERVLKASRITEAYRKQLRVILEDEIAFDNLQKAMEDSIIAELMEEQTAALREQVEQVKLLVELFPQLALPATDLTTDIDKIINKLDEWGASVGGVQSAWDGLSNEWQKNLDVRVNTEVSALRESEVYRNADAKSRIAMERKVKKEYAQEQKKIFRLNQLSSLADIAFSTSMGIMKATAASPLTLGMPWSTLIGVMGVLQAGLVLGQEPPAYALGGDFVTNGEKFIKVGDNPGGRERVQVTPLSSPNVNGPQSQGATIIFNNPIMTREFTRDHIIPQIKNAARLGFA